MSSMTTLHLFRPNKQEKGGNIHAVYKLTKVQANETNETES